jgi:hypothetical protein
VGELVHGSPAHRKLSQAEWVEWVGLMQVVEPAEAEERNAEIQRQIQERGGR